MNWVFNSTFPQTNDVFTQLLQNQHEFIRRLPSLFIPTACILEFVVPDILVTDTELEQKQMELLYSHNYDLSIMYTHSRGDQFRVSFLVTVYAFFLAILAER